MSQRLLCLLVTEEQEQILEGFFNHNDWDLNRIDPCDVPKYITSQTCTAVELQEEVALSSEPVSAEGHAEGAGGRWRDGGIGPNECPFCLCMPCVTNAEHRQMWWPEQIAAPSPHNRSIRNTMYKKFWGQVYNYGVWKDDRYIQ